MSTICVKYRLYPTSAQVTILNRTLDICRDVYNSLVNERTALYETRKESISLYSQQSHFKEWKKIHPELKTVFSQVLQDVSVRVDLAFKAFFRRVKKGDAPGHPRLKGAGYYDSITYTQVPSGCKLIGDYLQLSKVGQVRCVVHRPLIGTPKTCTIRRQAGKWFACFSCEYEPEALPVSTQIIGIDVGLEKFAALSDGTFIENPRFFRHDEKALSKARQKIDRCDKGSNARRKARKVASRIHERIRNRRHNFTHQLACRIVNQYGLIAIEKLNVKNMAKSPAPKQDESTGQYIPNGASQKAGLNKSILDASWSQFREVLTQKAVSAARQLVEVNPAYTSQTCYQCGHIAKKPLKERWHHCPICGLSLDRDTNAAFNILQTAVGQHSVTG